MSPPDADLLGKIKEFVAYDAVGVTAVRGQRPRTRDAVLKFLNRMEIAQIPRTKVAFKRWLDQQTMLLAKKLPDPAKPWGVARKALNLYLRACCYNHYLRGQYCLGDIETLLEVPVDSKVAGGLREANTWMLLPSWKGLKGLEPRANEAFQECAVVLSKRMGLPARVFLDHFLFLAAR
jgi:hypothetical protein